MKRAAGLRSLHWSIEPPSDSAKDSIREILPLAAVVWHDRHMPKPSRKPDKGDGARGIVEAATQDIELTIEQAEEAAKKAAHSAGVALGLTRDDTPSADRSSKKAPASAKKPAPSRAGRSKPKP